MIMKIVKFIIDFDRFDLEILEELTVLYGLPQVSPLASGMIDGYFDHKVPDLFPEAAIYILNNCWRFRHVIKFIRS